MPKQQNWQHIWRQLKARRGAVSRDIAKLEEKVRSGKAKVKDGHDLAALKKQHAGLTEEINKILTENA